MSLLPEINQASAEINKLVAQANIHQTIAPVNPAAFTDPADTMLLASRDPVIREVSVGMTGEAYSDYSVSGTPPLSLPNSLGKPLKAWEVDVLPKQEGTGDPAPDNVRPIHGTDKLTIYTDSKYGGLVEWNQIFPTQTINYSGTGFTITSDNNGVVVVTVTTDGTSENNAHNHTNMRIPISANGHKCILLSNSPDVKVQLKATGTESDSVFTATSGWNNVAFMFNNLSAGIYNVYPILCDLTQMFGAGNEPSTVEAFRALFPLDYYPYNAGQQMTVDQVNGAQYSPAVLTLPQTVYTGTIGSEGGVSRWGEVDLGTLTWIYHDEIYPNWPFFAAILSTKKKGWNNLLCSNYKLTSSIYARSEDNVISGVPYVNGNNIIIRDSSFNDDVVAFKTAMSGVQLVYELETPTTFSITTPTIPTPTGTATTWATAEDGTVESMEVTYYKSE